MNLRTSVYRLPTTLGGPSGMIASTPPCHWGVLSLFDTNANTSATGLLITTDFSTWII
jgi:hypothetical protein